MKINKQSFRRSLSCMALAGLIGAGGGAHAEPRYQVAPLHPGYEFGTEKALILDTVAGHMWIWVESPAVNNHDGGRYVIYQGQLSPGREMGDIVAEQHWPASKKK